jgi:uncharacterized membrane protein (DUF373 family)
MGSGPRSSDFGPFDVEAALEYSEGLIRAVEVVAAFVLVTLFAIGVADLSLQIVQSAISGRIVDPLVVVGFIDTALLLFIIVEIYQTVVAYTRESERRQIVRLVLYTGVIALVRKAIIFRTEVYDSSSEAILAAASYALLLLGVGAVLYVERRTATA